LIMDPLTLSTIAAMSGTSLLAGNPETKALRISKDSRTVRAGDLYVALSGERFDGNHFIAEAASKGAVAALCCGDCPSGLPHDFGILSTPDTLTGLTLLASAWRDRLNLRAVAVTGSSGKTTVKDFTKVVLGGTFRVTATEGNLNNHLGLPLSILAANLADQAAVWEIGMNHRGEISPLAGLARPDVGIITGIGSAHLEHLGSLEEIAAEKGDLLERIAATGFAILPAEDRFVATLRARTQATIIETGFEHGDIRAENVVQERGGSRFTISGQYGRAEAWLPVPGRHMVGNALMAVAAGLTFGIRLEECAASLGSVVLGGGRLGKLEIRGITFLDDTYNANPDSMVAALETLSNLRTKGRRIAVLGKMGELGDHAAAGYERVGNVAGRSADTVISVGPDASGIAEAARNGGCSDVRETAGNEEASELLMKVASPGDLVLLKGSRSARMEEILSQFS